MTPTQPPAPTEATASTPITDEPWRILSEWIGSGSDAHAAMAELAETGYVIVDTQRAFDMAVALADAHIDGNLEPCTCPDCLFALEFIADVQAHDAARQPEGVRE